MDANLLTWGLLNSDFENMLGRKGYIFVEIVKFCTLSGLGKPNMCILTIFHLTGGKDTLFRNDMFSRFTFGVKK